MATVPNGIFKPNPTGSEAKGDVTTRVAKEIMDGEVAAREAKTERLRQARLAKEAEQVTAAPPARKPVRKARKR